MLIAATQTFLRHDYETFGIQVRYDRPAQFAVGRNDANLKGVRSARRR